MTIRRYGKTKILGLNFRFGTSQAIPILRQNIMNGNIKYQEYILEENERLDILAGEFYGDSSLYWVLAACSDIGFALQVPPGTIIKIPDINDIAKYV
jgi:hypothetical protein